MQAPFNFVPLAEEVFFPDWADQISHDVPFSDGQSGMIRIRMTAKTPVFVRNGHTRDDKENKSEEYKSFSHTPDGRFFIPATSVKGMVRNILEIASFGKMAQISNKRYSIRDLHLRAYLDYFRSHKVRCGWMDIDVRNGIATVSDLGEPGRIGTDEIDALLGLSGNRALESFITQGNLTTEKNRFAKAKYLLLNEAQRRQMHSSFVPIANPNRNKVDPRKMYKYGNGGRLGTVVLTGQPGRRSPGKGKFYEFIFFDEVKATYKLDMNEENGVYDDFCFIYNDSEDWKYWKKTGQRIPVFFTVENGQIQYMGLSYLFKLPFKKHLKEFLNKMHRSKQRDLAECIFGTVDGEALKGRVQFSHAFCSNPQVGEEVRPYMGSPKPTYYPIYTQQQGRNGLMYDEIKNKMLTYKTFLDEDAKLRGWKRYPVREAAVGNPPVPNGQDQNTSPFRPLKPGCVFECTVRYHNLRECELGALIYALNVTDTCFYSLGFCKPYGYGVVKMELLDMAKEERDRLRKIFTDMMVQKIPDYQRTSQLLELKAMMAIQENGLLEQLAYLRDPKDFAKLKKQNIKNKEYGEYQRNYTELIRREVKVKKQTAEALEAEITYAEKGTVKAKLLKTGERLVVDMNGRYDKLKIGNRIVVNKIKRGGSTVLLYLRKA